ncbi:PAF acetylhydrolase family protein [Periconia macrospinosa]|uniref:1-alkyl-2-acetylglycerophosphocholine esterase n=1 Tax=Periconia macrospinosa TaxID=97972 RepID=A0A2V1CY60_9PLEO|nr:PAF acetylhydrolase family protein [Periconia macrospinosa]
MQPLLSILPLLLTHSAVAFILPSPPGQYNVTLTTGPLIDSSRNNWVLMVSVFRPAICASTVAVPNMPERTAKYQASYAQRMFNVTEDLSSQFLQAQLPVCECNSSTTALVKDTPVLILSHGLEGTRLYHNVIASALASEGFTVITTDHPSDTNIIEYPNGHEITNNITFIPEVITKLIEVRAADASFIIDQLSNATAMAELGLGPFPTDRVAMLGHSLGGVTSVHAAAKDPRIRAAINWDGTLEYNPPLAQGISQPVSLVATDRPTDTSWEEAWSKLNGPKLWTKIAGLQHVGFIDLRTILKAAGQDINLFPELFGMIDPDELKDMLVAYTTEWMNGAFAGKVGGPLLEGEEPDRFPAVSVIKKDNY